MMMAAILLPCGLSVVCKIATPKGVFEVLTKDETIITIKGNSISLKLEIKSVIYFHIAY